MEMERWALLGLAGARAREGAAQVSRGYKTFMAVGWWWVEDEEEAEEEEEEEEEVEVEEVADNGFE